MGEETTTETVLYEIARRHQSGDYIAIPATRAAESKHGADWFWWFGDKRRGVGFRVQAKKLFPSGRYESLFKKKGDPYSQLKTLVNNANKASQIPLYCFYNFNFGGIFAKCKHQCMHDYRGPSYWGCAIALPEDVMRQKSDSARDLEEYMLPWHLLVCTKGTAPLTDAVFKAGRMLAEKKPSRESEDGTVHIGRERLDVSFHATPTPQDILDIFEIQERSRRIDAQIEGWGEIDTRAQNLLDEQGVGGLAIFMDTRLV